MNCPTCNLPMTPVYQQSHLHCTTCNTFEFPTEIEKSEDGINPAGKETDFQCPKCEQALEVGMIDQTQVCFCRNCRGYVVDNQSFAELAQNRRANYQGPDDQPRPIDPDSLNQSVDCPACGYKMGAHPYYGPGNVVLDTCDACQLLWLDHGELSTITRAPGTRPTHEKIPGAGDIVRDAYYREGAARSQDKHALGEDMFGIAYVIGRHLLG